MTGNWTLRALGLALGLMAAAPAGAAPRICSDLEAELAQSGTGGGSSLARRYDTAIVQQKQQLARINSQARRLGCGSYDEDYACGALDETMGRMEDNLDTLIRTRRRMAGDGQAESRMRQRLLARIEAYGCRGGTPDDDRFPDSVRSEPQRPKARDAERLHATVEPKDMPAAAPVPKAATPQSSANPAATFRTLCVRTCDGYFFPMTYAAGPADFDRDQTACQNACPGTEVQLYIYRTADQNPESMVSAVGGTPYRALPTAFRYRDPGAEKPASCSCAAQKRNFSVIAGDGKPETPPVAAAPRSSPAPDPVTTASKSTATKTPQTAAPDARPATGDQDRKVRAVGPSFLPDPKAAIDLRTPAPN